jgi:hypothetical protein
LADTLARPLLYVLAETAKLKLKLGGVKMDGSKRDYISKALKIVDDMLDLANSKEALGDENGCGTLSGVMRDCAYKIRQAAEGAAGNGKKWRKPIEPVLVIFAAAVLAGIGG